MLSKWIQSLSNPKLLFIVLGVIVIVVYVLYIKTRSEGFYDLSAPLPSAAQESMIPANTPGATTANPTVSLAPSKDIQATMEALQNFMALAQQTDPQATNMPDALKVQAIQMKATAPDMIQKLQAGLSDPTKNSFTTADLAKKRADLETISNALRNVSMAPAGAAAETTAIVSDAEYKAAIDAQPKPTTVATPAGALTLDQIRNLRDRINEESLRLANLRSVSPTLKARITQLDALSADLSGMIDAVERKAKRLEDLPIQADSAEAFLKKLKDDTVPLPALITPFGAAQAKNSHVPPIVSTPATEGNRAVQQLLENAQYLKWNLNIKLEYNPELAARDRILSRLEAMEKRLTDLSISETPLPKEVYAMYMKELEALHTMLSSSKSMPANGKPLEAIPHSQPYASHSRGDILSSAPEFPGQAQMDSAQGAGFGTTAGKFPNGEISPDVYIRPGFVMNDATIAHRASASAFDPSSVGGPDYKKRAQELCRQIQGAQLGDPASFGCIHNPDEVGSSYSWKGNYQMVCNRVGDTWGGWYPEMFGCPKYDPSAKFQGTMM